MNANRLLDRLDGVNETGSGRWIALCPAHADRSPSLSVREMGDGRILVHCFAGCEPGDVLAALGLGMSDLFPARLPGSGLAGGYARSHSGIPAGDLLKIIAEEALLVGIIAADLLSSRAIHEADWQRLSVAVGRIGTVADYARR